MLLARSNILRQISRRTCYPAMFPRGIRNLFIQTMETPSEQALKFLPSVQILKENETREFLSGREAACSPLALKLFSIDGIKTIMFGSNFITVEKANDEIDWSVLKPEIFSILTEYLTNGSPIINEESELSSDVEINEEDDEIVAMIKELIFTRIKPAIQEDGGDIEFVKFIEENGTVFLKLKGACRSCDSSTVTLKNGIESMLKFYIEEVETVEQISEDDTTEITEQFQKEDLHLTPRARGDPPNL
ncbi:Piso0_004632 [Millerozyma farinosa CBS 7064]|uniref:Piso0_004632 protein n=1 Tax=Pichia sorbitophila (strain ATCC MYA-4447 / BCRC 22081 / CBS 7064 / NBRC 10061 / NRRL Y-12695) TaxID=559304 RepID=G8Y9B6_PICSO|nr:Piso0_004632 [Millerozyma farinosa CBS 7064]CCE85061.1 Piso0_004632 [Millerozyma farinosa CBS 7064]